jgi:hypothetical protein
MTTPHRMPPHMSINKFIEYRNKFLKNETEHTDVMKFEKGGGTDDMKTKLGLQGPGVPSPKKPLFSYFIEDIIPSGKPISLLNGAIKFNPEIAKIGGDGNLLLYKKYENGITLNKNHILLLNAQAPYTEVYPDANKLLAGMAFTHLLVIPERRLFNSVSLTQDDIPLLEVMKSTALNYLQKLENRKILIQNTKKVLEEKMEKFKLDDTTRNEIRKRFTNDEKKFLSSHFRKLDDIQFYLHVSPLHSIGQLHMHALPKDFRTSPLHEEESVKVDDLIQFLRGMGQRTRFGKKTKKTKKVFSLKQLKTDLKKVTSK